LQTVARKWVLITGAASGIGLSAAHAFAKRGANVVLVDVNDVALAKAAAGISTLGVECVALRCDVSSEVSVAEAAVRVRDRGIVPDVLINNAGVAFLGAFLETPVDQWQRILAVNVMGIVHMVRAFLPAMTSADGQRVIVNVASAAAYLPAPNMAAYAASKGAVKQLSEVLAMELDGGNVAVQCVYPGIINTPIVSGVNSVGRNITGAQLATLQRYYVEKGGSPDDVGEDIANAVVGRKAHLHTGPMARLGNVVSRLSPALARKLSLTAARSNGYLPGAN
jgi:short-subunit dehydrogenase